MRGPLNIPAIIYIPAGTYISSRELARVVGGPSRATISSWRWRYSFPACEGRGLSSRTRTADVAAWLVARGYRIEWT